MAFIALTKLQNREPTPLQTVINNTGGKLNVTLKSFHYEVGYHNVDPHIEFTIASDLVDGFKPFRLHGGLYTFEQISRFFKESVHDITIGLNISGLVELKFPPSVFYVVLDSTLTQFLGITRVGADWFTQKFVGDTPVKLIVHKWLYIYLDQLSTTSNIVDGAPSTLLAIIPASPIKGIISTTPSNPTYKKLEVGHIYQLNLRVLDENGIIVKNHGKSMTAVLDIRENDVCSFD